MLNNKKIVLGVCSSAAAVKAPKIAGLLAKEGAQVFPVLTEKAVSLVSREDFVKACGRKASVNVFDEKKSLLHLELAKSDLIIVAPATANFLAKTAHGIADDLLTTVILATKTRVVVAPAMNTGMYENELTQENLRKLRALGFEVIEPAVGKLACGVVGRGRLPEPEEIVGFAKELLEKEKDFVEKTFLITAGPTREYLDDVRFVSNASSGRMGFEIAREAVSRGARVVLVSGATQLQAPNGVELHRVETAGEMLGCVKKFFHETDFLVCAAAVSDFSFRRREGKISKKEMPSSLEIASTPDILSECGKNKEKQEIIGFSLTTALDVGKAREKLLEKNADLIIANDLTSINSSEINPILVSRDCEKALGKMSKRVFARVLLNELKKKCF